MKVFISQPMRGKTEQEILEERSEIIQRAKERFSYVENLEIIDSYKLLKDYSIADDEKTSLKFLGESIKALADADVAYFGKGWEKARGCRIENQCAMEYGITVIEIY
jgi:hypothetical protein